MIIHSTIYNRPENLAALSLKFPFDCLPVSVEVNRLGNYPDHYQLTIL